MPMYTDTRKIFGLIDKLNAAIDYPAKKKLFHANKSLIAESSLSLTTVKLLFEHLHSENKTKALMSMIQWDKVRVTPEEMEILFKELPLQKATSIFSKLLENGRISTLGHLNVALANMPETEALLSKIQWDKITVPWDKEEEEIETLFKQLPLQKATFIFSKLFEKGGFYPFHTLGPVNIALENMAEADRKSLFNKVMEKHFNLVENSSLLGMQRFGYYSTPEYSRIYDDYLSTKNLEPLPPRPPQLEENFVKFHRITPEMIQHYISKNLHLFKDASEAEIASFLQKQTLPQILKKMALKDIVTPWRETIPFLLNEVYKTKPNALNELLKDLCQQEPDPKDPIDAYARTQWARACFNKIMNTLNPAEIEEMRSRIKILEGKIEKKQLVYALSDKALLGLIQTEPDYLNYLSTEDLKVRINFIIENPYMIRHLSLHSLQTLLSDESIQKSTLIKELTTQQVQALAENEQPTNRATDINECKRQMQLTREKSSQEQDDRLLPHRCSDKPQ